MKKNINEAPVKVNPLLYSNTKFEDYVVGSSAPSKDKINPSLLSDINKAAKSANINVSITTAVSGHDRGSRHEVGNAVDIAKINGIGILSLENAKKMGIYDKINNFVNELVKMGYVKNSESGNDKAVLTFGFKGHDNHVHVSRNSDGDTSSDTTKTLNGDTSTETVTEPESEADKATNDLASYSITSNLLNSITESVVNDINKIKKLMK